MRKPTLTALLTASTMAFTGVALAQQDAELKVERQGEDRATISVDQSAQQQGDHQKSQHKAQKSEQARNQKTVKGTVVSLQTYLEQGAEAAKQEMAMSAGTEQPKALISEDGELYVILGQKDAQRDRMGQRDISQSRIGQDQLSQRSSTQSDLSQSSRIQSDRSQSDSQQARVSGELRSSDSSADLSARASSDSDTQRGAADRDPEDPQKLRMTRGYEVSAGDEAQSERSTEAQADARVSLDTDAQRQQQDVTATPGLERHTNRADMSARGESQVSDRSVAEILRDQDAADRQARDINQGDSQVFGYAAQSRDELRVGEKVEITGEVFDRDGVKGILVSDANPAE